MPAQRPAASARAVGPAVVLVDGGGNCKLLDSGRAGREEAAGGPSGSERRTLTAEAPSPCGSAPAQSDLLRTELLQFAPSAPPSEARLSSQGDPRFRAVWPAGRRGGGPRRDAGKHGQTGSPSLQAAAPKYGGQGASGVGLAERRLLAVSSPVWTDKGALWGPFCKGTGSAPAGSPLKAPCQCLGVQGSHTLRPSHTDLGLGGKEGPRMS